MTLNEDVVDIVDIHTDGACLGNPGPGGWAVLIKHSSNHHGTVTREIVGGDCPTTNNRMELMAAISALEALGDGHCVTLTTDSEYVRKGITEWIEGWTSRNWKTATGSPVKNRDLWERLLSATQKHQIHWKWVKGHSGDPNNDRVDALAREQAAQHKQTTTGIKGS